MQMEAANAIDRVFAQAAEDERKQPAQSATVIDFAARAAARKKAAPCA